MSQQLQTTSELRETDFNSAIRARDEALKDAKILASRVESLEEAIQQQVFLHFQTLPSFSRNCIAFLLNCFF